MISPDAQDLLKKITMAGYDYKDHEEVAITMKSLTTLTNEIKRLNNSLCTARRDHSIEKTKWLIAEAGRPLRLKLIDSYA